MRLPVEWIREYVAIEADAEEIAARLTMAGLEVEETEESALGPVLNIKVTPNRGDGLSVVGVARELAAAYRMPLEPTPSPAPSASGAGLPRDLVAIEAPDFCPRYAARMVRNLKIGPSPEWLQARLTAAGMRPIHNVVDITNYVMLEMGQPLHAFDYDRLAGHRIVVRRARAGETLVTLDEIERTLTPEMLVICDAEKPIAIAGVMGGVNSEIGETTRTMLLESAHFHPLSIRRTARALNMRTEASYRFERHVDPMGVPTAADRVCMLLAEMGVGEVDPGVVDVYPVPLPSRVIDVRPKRVSAMLGFEVPASSLTDSLTRLGFEQDAEPVTSRGQEAIRFTVPSWRSDIMREIDVVEEVGRVLGYEHIPEKLPYGVSTQGGDSAWGRFAERVREILIGTGLQEVVTHSLLAPNHHEDEREAPHRITIRSALSAELSGLRRSLLPGLIEVIERNARRGQTPLAFFEVGNVFHLGEERHSETTSVGGALVGPIVPPSWSRDVKVIAADFYTGRGLVERLADGLGIAEIDFAPGDDPRLHPGRQAAVLLEGDPIGYVGELHPDRSADLQGRDRVIVFELLFDALQHASMTKHRFEPLSAYPTIVRDLAPRLESAVAYRTVYDSVRRTGIDILKRFDLTDVFTGHPLPEGVKALTLSFTFRAPDRTLTDAEVNDALAQLRSALEADCGATFIG